MADETTEKRVDAPDANGPPRDEVVKALSTDEAIVEIGGTRLKRGMVVEGREEFLAELRGKRGLKKYQEMADNDPVIAAGLLAADLMIRKVEWEAVPAGEEPEHIEDAEFLAGARDDMSMDWEGFVSDALTMLPFGWSLFELVYKVRRGPDQEDSSLRSRFDDGLIGWRKWAPRPQGSKLEWIYDDDGGVAAMKQHTDGGPVEIPIEKAILFKLHNRMGHPEGRSLIRPAYIPYYHKREIERLEGIGIERDLAGFPVGYVPPKYYTANATETEQAIRNDFEKAIRDMKRDEQEGLTLPAMYDDRGNQLFKVELLSTGGNRQFDIDATVARKDQRIALSLLAQFLMLGMEKVGSFALASEQTNLFGIAMGAILDALAGPINRFAIPRLWQLNGWTDREPPKLKPGDVEKADVEQWARAVNLLSTAGVPILPSEDLERRAYDMLDVAAPETPRDQDEPGGRQPIDDEPGGGGGGEGDDDGDGAAPGADE